MAEEIKIRLSAEGSARKNIADVTKSVGVLEKDVKRIGNTFKRVFEVAAGNVIGGAFTGAVNGAARSAKALFQTFVVDGVRAAQVQEDAIQRLNTALAQSGQFSVEASEDLQKFASALQQTTKFGDETILNAQALLQSLGRLDEEGLKQATVAALDMSAALGIDLNAAVTLVGKAAAGEISSFTRYGVVIKKGADKTETFNNTLIALNKNFGGAAAAQIQTFSGAIAQSGNSFGDLQEEIGLIITKNASINALIQESSKLFKDLGDAVSDNREELQALASEGILFLIDGVSLAVGGLENLINAFQNTRKFALSLQATFASIAGDTSTEQAIVDQIFAIQKQQDATGNAFDKTREKIVAFQESIKNAGTTSAAAQDALNKKLEAQSLAAKQAAEGVKTLEASQKAAAASGLALAKGLGVEGVASPAEKQKAEQAEIQALREQDLISQEEFFVRQGEIKQAAFDLELEQIKAAKSEGLLVDGQAAAAQKANKAKLAGDLNKITLASTKFEQDQRKRNEQSLQTSLSNLATLQTSGSKTAFRIGQAAAIAQAGINITTGISNALAGPPTGPPFPLNLLLATSIGVAQGLNIAKIAGAKPPALAGGIDEVPAGFSNDTFPAFLQSGERVVPSQTNQDLKAFLAGSNNQTPLLASINAKLDNLGAVVVNVGGDTIANVVRQELESGGTLLVEA